MDLTSSSDGDNNSLHADYNTDNQNTTAKFTSSSSYSENKVIIGQFKTLYQQGLKNYLQYHNHYLKVKIILMLRKIFLAEHEKKINKKKYKDNILNNIYYLSYNIK